MGLFIGSGGVIMTKIDKIIDAISYNAEALALVCQCECIDRDKSTLIADIKMTANCINSLVKQLEEE